MRAFAGIYVQLKQYTFYECDCETLMSTNYYEHGLNGLKGFLWTQIAGTVNWWAPKEKYEMSE